MIKKCEHPGCTRTGNCRAPKTRDLREYWYFCQEHAAEYNKNWNYYADMTPEEVEADWERETFGAPLRDKNTAAAENADYVKFINDFITGRSTFDRRATPAKKSAPGPIVAALHELELSPGATWRDCAARYRALAKKYHPDTAADTKNATEKFTRISAAYETLKKYFGKK